MHRNRRRVQDPCTCCPGEAHKIWEAKHPVNMLLQPGLGLGVCIEQMSLKGSSPFKIPRPTHA